MARRTASVYNLRSQCAHFGPSAEADTAEIEYIAPAFLPESFFFEKPLVD